MKMHKFQCNITHFMKSYNFILVLLMWEIPCGPKKNIYEVTEGYSQ